MVGLINFFLNNFTCNIHCKGTNLVLGLIDSLLLLLLDVSGSSCFDVCYLRLSLVNKRIRFLWASF